MFIEQVGLSKKSWHSKLMNFIWGWKPNDFSHICPYFWLTVFNIIIFVPVLAFKIIFVYPYRVFNEWQGSTSVVRETMAEIEYQKWAEDYLQLILTDNKERERFYRMHIPESPSNKYWRFMYIFLRSTDKIDKEFRILLMTERGKVQKEVEEEKRRQKIAKKQKINDVLRYIKPISQVILGIFTIGLVTLFGWFLYWFFSEGAAMVNWVTVISVVLAIIICFVLIILMGVGAAHLGEVIKEADDVEHPNVVQRAWLSIKSFFSLVGQMIKNSCPAIKWED